MLPMGVDGMDAGRVNGVADRDRPDGSDRPEGSDGPVGSDGPAEVRNFAEADEADEGVDAAPQGDELGEDEVAAIRASQADPDTPPPDAPVG